MTAPRRCGVIGDPLIPADLTQARQLPAATRKLKIIATACAYGCLAYQSVEPIEELKQEIHAMAVTVGETVGRLLERLEAQQRSLQEMLRITHRNEERAGQDMASVLSTGIGESFEPHGCFVYILWGDDPERPVYVGKSTNILTRLGSHMGEATKRRLTTRIELLRCNGTPVMDRTEIRLIRQYRPLLNKSHNEIDRISTG
jgi:hypothetical protein